ncbi:nicotinate-nucleotide--dimethylbenzimidazole phosphoribosyltransferase [Pseudoroseomonas globiformis]|uniref:Nicotinate-nucleotide--dimethylbenzimidazole phosphoribosyltransferase n=1 Tax=Teichococcus globiformis TaxID=2307229 RepID=A0ABV7FVX2_9PROT
MPFHDLKALREAALHPIPGDDAAAAAADSRQARLTKPPGSLGRLEGIPAWLARWQSRSEPRLERVAVLVFAGNHGVAAQGVSPYPSAVTEQMVANFAAGGGAINQIARLGGAALHVVPLELDRPTEDFTERPAMDEADFLAAVNAGVAAVAPGTDLLCLGEMGIGNTTAGAAMAAALFGGAGWAGRGTGLDDAGLARKEALVRTALARHPEARQDPLQAARCLGGRELAAILGATLAARQRGIPVLLDGFTCTAAAAPLALLAPGGLDHVLIGHLSAESGHGRMAAALDLVPLLDLGLRLGEGSGAALAIMLVRAALECHRGMASFASAGIAGPAA